MVQDNRGSPVLGFSVSLYDSPERNGGHNLVSSFLTNTVSPLIRSGLSILPSMAGCGLLPYWSLRKLIGPIHTIYRLRQKPYLYLYHLDFITSAFSSSRLPSLSSPVAKLAFVPQNLLIIFNWSPHIFEAIFKGSFP